MPKPNKTIAKIYNELRDSRDEAGEAIIENKTVAKIIRVKLREAFPGAKFTVRCSKGDAVNISWDNGPSGEAVDAIVGGYSFGGFDGMIDMAYSSKNWLLPNGDISHAACEGTAGSMGVVSDSATDCPEPGAIVVKYGPKYVFTHRNVTQEVMMAAVMRTLIKHGQQWDHSSSLWRQRLNNGEYVVDVIRQSGELEKAVATVEAAS